MFSKFGRQIFSLYEKRPLLMNSIVGGSVYIAGEYTVQTQSKDVRFFDMANWKKLAQVGALGSIENGFVMLKWYGLLNKYVGSGVGTGTVLFKCLLDQIFFATQQDAMFLGLCAWSESEAFSDAIQEVKETFLTTWIVDCSLWPVVNFVGFAFVPYILQPTYMAFVSYFWQLYLSATAASGAAELSDEELETLFRALDTDNSNFIDAHELQAFFLQRNITVSDAEIKQMIADADQIGREFYFEDVEGMGVVKKAPHTDDGVVSLDEFKKLATHGSKFNLKSSALWSSVRQDIALTKGAKHAMKRLEVVQKHREVEHARKQAQHSADVEQTAQLQTAEKSTPGAAAGTTKGDILNTREGECAVPAHAPEQAPRPVGLVQYVLQQLATVDKAETPNNAAAVAAGTGASAPTAPTITVASATIIALQAQREQEERDRHARELDENRVAAIHKATIGGAVLTTAVLFRKLVFKI